MDQKVQTASRTTSFGSREGSEAAVSAPAPPQRAGAVPRGNLESWSGGKSTDGEDGEG